MANLQGLKFDDTVEFFKMVKESGHEHEIPDMVFRQLICKHFNVIDVGAITRLVRSFEDVGLIKDISNPTSRNKIYELQYKELLSHSEKISKGDQAESESPMPETV